MDPVPRFAERTMVLFESQWFEPYANRDAVNYGAFSYGAADATAMHG